MGIDLAHQDERDNMPANLDDPFGLVAKLLPEDVSHHYCLIGFIDPYGDTVFNRLQTPLLISELKFALGQTRDARVKDHGLKMLALTERCRNEMHTYLKFRGD